MDRKQYKSIQTQRGHTYSYYLANEQATETILFLHGFPSSSQDWAEQVKFFSAKGYKIIAPDLLGYGGSSKPTDPIEYKLRAIANDVIDIRHRRYYQGYCHSTRLVSPLNLSLNFC